ncbi:MAG: glucosamine-6-phosphate deaminase [Candidatus Wallbacteria bacterium]|nr:glucosamine-6-phosphate deaminase [Candidatus Wallbacteria bacterium]
MEIIIHQTPEAAAERSARIVSDLIRNKNDVVLGLATGSTPLAFYRKLIELHKKEKLSFKRVRTFNLDEYVGIPATHPQSFRYYMEENLFKHIDIVPENTHVPDGMMENPMLSGPAYEMLINEAGGIDLQILGIGANGHIGFNEPTSSLSSSTRVKTLTKKTLSENKRFFKPDEFQPFLAITMGIATIMESRRILLLATGEKKAEAVAATIEGPISSMCPASVLQWHPKVSLILDSQASSLLKHTEYYKFVLSLQDGLTEKFGDPR